MLNNENENFDTEEVLEGVYNIIDDMSMTLFGTDDINEANSKLDALADNNAEETTAQLNTEAISEDLINRLDGKFNALIDNILGEAATEYNYTHNDLDKKVNSDQTLREYIRDTELEFEREPAAIDEMSDEKLNNYVKQLDALWRLSSE